MKRVQFRTGELALVLGFALFNVYALFTLKRISGGDSGELVLVAHTLGVAHPPGYPLFTILGKLFSLLPFSTIAYRVALLSGAANAAAAALLFLAVEKWSDSRWGGIGAALLFAFSPLAWKYATTPEV